MNQQPASAPSPSVLPAGYDAAAVRWDSAQPRERALLLAAISAGPDGQALGWTGLQPLTRALLRIHFADGCPGDLRPADREALAEVIDCHPMHVWACITGRKNMDAALAAHAERMTGLRRWFLRQDDWWDIWPELIGRPGVPEPKAPPLPRIGVPPAPLQLQPQCSSAAA
jgi:hypothetical protein